MSCHSLSSFELYFEYCSPLLYVWLCALYTPKSGVGLKWEINPLSALMQTHRCMVQCWMKFWKIALKYAPSCRFLHHVKIPPLWMCLQSAVPTRVTHNPLQWSRQEACEVNDTPRLRNGAKKSAKSTSRYTYILHRHKREKETKEKRDVTYGSHCTSQFLYISSFFHCL